MVKRFSSVNALNYSDGQIDSYRLVGDSFYLNFTSWNEKRIKIILTGVLWLTDNSCIGRDLSHHSILISDSYIDKLKEMLNDEEDYACYEVWSADIEDYPVLRVVCQGGSFEELSGSLR